MKSRRIGRGKSGKPSAKDGTSGPRESAKMTRRTEEGRIRFTVNGQPYDLEIGDRPNAIDP